MGNQVSDNRKMIDVKTSILDLEDYDFPEMLDTSSILTDDHIKQMYHSMPLRVQSARWKLSYSTNEHGYSLSTMYRNLKTIDGPVLIVVKEFQGTILGVLTSDPLEVRSRWFGRCESFLFTFKPDFRKYGPTFINNNCIFCSPSYVMFGGSKNGSCGLYLGEDFCAGSSSMCDTYGNKPLAKSEDFLIRTVEVWTFSEDEW